MPFVYNFPFFSIFLAMLAGIITPFLKNGKMAQRVSFVMIALVGAMSGILLFSLMQDGGASYTYMMGHFPAPWGNELRAGPLEALMALAFSLVMLLCLCGGLKDIFEDILPEKQKFYFIMINLLFSSLLALVYTNDVFTAYVFIEINTIAACAIVMAKDSGETIVATLRYLIMSLLGSGLFLIGIILLYGITGHLLMSDIQNQVVQLASTGRYAMPLTVVVGLIALGLSIKSALFPFHSWLPGAHGSATTASSSILSGLVLKGYIILLIKLFYRVFTIEVIRELHVNNILFFFGLAGMIAGSLRAMKETHIKRMVAYSSVAQIGYIYMGIGMGTGLGVVAACFHILAHAFTKPMLFATAGALSATRGHKKEFHDLKGSAYDNKLAGVGFTVGALSMVGMPLLAGFVSKLYFAMGSLDEPGRMWWTLLVLAASSVLNALYYIPAVIAIWTPVKKGADAPVQKVRPGLAFVFSVVLFLIANFALGVGFAPVIRVIESGLSLL
ncbi:MAG: proton-conducting transporter membrane subunit [Oscillospiraceae bacterium]|nr:proton-conducting transporter membrane subunit [Oscillospiraceae bacterium]